MREWSDFVNLSDADVASCLQAAGSPCWAVASGGTRRAYLAQGGQLTQPSHLEDYFRWLDAAQRAWLDQLFAMGVTTVIAVEHVPLNRGAQYQALARAAIQMAVSGPERRAWYAAHHLRVRIAGDIAPLAADLDIPAILQDWQQITESTAQATGPTLIYLFRGDWIDVATEEASYGYQIGMHLGHVPTRADLVQAFYGDDTPPLTVYLGSGRPHLRHLRPPFLSGQEDCYWHASPLLRLSQQGLRRIIYDHLWGRRTSGNRSYQQAGSAAAEVRVTLADYDDWVLGLGYRHPLGFWLPIDGTKAAHAS